MRDPAKCIHENIGIAQDGSGIVQCCDCGQEYVPKPYDARITLSPEALAEGRRPTHLLIARAAATDPGGGSAETRIALDTPPDRATREEYQEATASVYEQTHGEKPERLATVVLPWVDTLDRGDDD